MIVGFHLEEAVEILERTPAVLRAKLEGLSENWLRADEGPDTWSPFDVVGHFIHGEKTDWIPRARIILARGDHPAFEPFDRFAQERDSAGRSLGDLLDEFAERRADNLRALSELGLGPDDMALKGIHPEFGEVTLEQLMATWVAHDLGHLAQIDRVMANRWRDEAGPWREYLRILD